MHGSHDRGRVTQTQFYVNAAKYRKCLCDEGVFSERCTGNFFAFC